MIKKTGKEELLLQSFEVLKDNLDKNDEKIKDIIIKIAKNNLPLAIDMWRYVLVNGEAYIKEHGYRVVYGVLQELGNKIGVEEVLNILQENDDILESTFGKTGCTSPDYLWYALRYNYPDLAEKMYELLKKNRFKDDSLTEIIETVCESFANEFEYIQDADDDDDYVAEEHRANEVANILLGWVKNLRDKEAKARITVTLIDYI